MVRDKNSLAVRPFTAHLLSPPPFSGWKKGCFTANLPLILHHGVPSGVFGAKVAFFAKCLLYIWERFMLGMGLSSEKARERHRARD